MKNFQLEYNLCVNIWLWELEIHQNIKDRKLDAFWKQVPTEDSGHWMESFLTDEGMWEICSVCRNPTFC